MDETRRIGLLVSRMLLLAVSGICMFGGCVQWASAGPALVDLSIIDRESGQALPTYQQGDRFYVAGTPGARYSLRVHNMTNARVMVVMSVDGINIITGQTANFNQTGYVLDAWRSYDLSGWRKSETEIAAFEFSSVGRSYAASTGRPSNVGVIGMAVFQEKMAQPVAPPQFPPTAARSELRDGNSVGIDAAKSGTATPAVPDAPVSMPREEGNFAAAGPGADGRARNAEEAKRIAPSQAVEKLGTTHGQREFAVSSRTEFERATWRPASIKVIEYDQYENLVAAGVIRPYGVNRHPSPFPLSGAQAGFVPDPPNPR